MLEDRKQPGKKGLPNTRLRNTSRLHSIWKHYIGNLENKPKSLEREICLI